MCISPIFLRNHINTEDGVKPSSGRYVPCGKCPECLKKKQRDWFVRFWLEDRANNKKGLFTYFLTLTYDDEHLVKSRHAALLDWQAFLKTIKRKVSDNVRFYVVSENGSRNGRLHFHALLFGLPPFDIMYFNKQISKFWHRGFTFVKMCNGKDFNYVCKYVTKDTDPYRRGDSFKTICTCSKRPPIGEIGCNEELVKYLNNCSSNFLHINGYSYVLPRYLDTRFVKQSVRSVRSYNSPVVELLSEVQKQDVIDCYEKKCREASMKKKKRIANYDLSNR